MADLSRLRTLVREDQTHFLELTNHFFQQFFQNELVSSGSEARLTTAHVLAILAVPPVLYTLYLAPAYTSIFVFFPQDYASVCLINQCRYVTFSMVVIGFVALLEWDALFMDHRDFAILASLPLRPAIIFTAKIAALVLFLFFFLVDVCAIPTVLFPVVETMGLRGAPISSLHFADMVESHAVAVFGAGAFVFLFFVAIQGVLLNVLSARAFKRASLCIQTVGMISLLLLLFLLPIFSDLVPAWQRAPFAALYRFPPLWFVGIYQTISGSNDPLFLGLAKTGVLAFGVVALVCAASYALNYKRNLQRALESEEAHPPGASRLAKLAPWLLTRLYLLSPQERATYFFSTKTLVRSARHRVYLAAYVGAGFALAAFGVFQALVDSRDLPIPVLLGEPQESTLAIPLILTFFLLSGMRVAFTVPAELRANWVFQISENERRLDGLKGVRKVMTLRAAFLVAALFPIYAYLWGWLPAIQQRIFTSLLAMILIEVLLINFRKIPFTCAYQPGKANITLFGFLYLLAFTTYTYTMAALERWALRDGSRWLSLTVVLAVCLAALIWRRTTANATGFSIIYEDAKRSELQTLNLRG